jgi:hypothetical protein
VVYLPFLIAGVVSLLICVRSIATGKAPTAGDAVYREEEPLTFDLYSLYYGVVGLVCVGGALYAMTG